MPRRIGNTVVPRNPVARSVSMRRSGAHERSRTSQRMQSRARVRVALDDWREELAFEQEIRVDSDT